MRSYVQDPGMVRRGDRRRPLEDLRVRGLVDGDAFSEKGEELRGEIELSTDRQERSIVEAIGDDFEELCMILSPMKDAIVAGGGYPRDPATMTRP